VPSRPAAASQLLSWAFAPFSTWRNRGSTSRRLYHARYGPPSGFGYPLDGLLPAIPCRFCFTPAALVGFTLRSFLLSEGIRFVSDPEEPTYRFSHRYTRTEVRAGSMGRGSWASALPGVPGSQCMLFTRRLLVAPLGFAPLGVPQTPRPGFRPASSHALFRHRLFTRAAVPQSIDRRLLRPALFRSKLRGSSETPLWGSCTGLHPEAFERTANRAIFFTSRRVAHYCRLADALELAERPTGVVRIG
jgi:hypothetical protein